MEDLLSVIQGPVEETRLRIIKLLEQEALRSAILLLP